MKITYVSVFILLPVFAFSQEAGKVAFIDKTINPGEVVDELPLPPPVLEGQFYIDEKWNPGSLTLHKRKAITLEKIRFDLQNNNLEIKQGDEVKVCTLGLIDKFEIGEGEVYHNLLMVSKNLPAGVGKVLFQGQKITLIEHIYLDVKESTYNVALDMGTRNHQSVLKRKYFLKNQEAVNEIKPRLKKNKSYFGNDYEKLAEFASKKNLHGNGIDNFISVLAYYDTFF